MRVLMVQEHSSRKEYRGRLALHGGDVNRGYRSRTTRSGGREGEQYRGLQATYRAADGLISPSDMRDLVFEACPSPCWVMGHAFIRYRGMTCTVLGCLTTRVQRTGYHYGFLVSKEVSFQVTKPRDAAIR